MPGVYKGLGFLVRACVIERNFSINGTCHPGTSRQIYANNPVTCAIIRALPVTCFVLLGEPNAASVIDRLSFLAAAASFHVLAPLPGRAFEIVDMPRRQELGAPDREWGCRHDGFSSMDSAESVSIMLNSKREAVHPLGR